MQKNLIVNAVLICGLMVAVTSLRNFYQDVPRMPAAQPASSERDVGPLAVLADGINPLGGGSREAGRHRQSGKD